MLMRKGGWQGGSKMQNPREIRGSKWSNPVNFERILVRIVRVWARLSSFSSNPCSKAVQNDHIDPAKGVEALQQFRRFSLAPDRDQGYVARHSGSDLTLVERARRDAMALGISVGDGCGRSALGIGPGAVALESSFGHANIAPRLLGPPHGGHAAALRIAAARERRNQDRHSGQSRMAAQARTRSLLHLREELCPPAAADTRRPGALGPGNGRGPGRGDSRSVSRSGVSLRARFRRAQGRDGGHCRGPRGAASSTSPSGTSCASKPSSRAWSSWNRTARSVTGP